MNDNTAAASTTVANDNVAQKPRSYPRVVTPRTIKEGTNKNGTPFVSFIGEFKRAGSDKVRTMFHTASGSALEAIRADLKEGLPIRVFGVFDEMPADGERKARQVYRIIGKSMPKGEAKPQAEEMKEAA